MFARTTATAIALVLVSASAANAQTDPEVVDNGTGDAVVLPLNKSVAAVEPGDSEWVAITWTALEADARELKVTAIGSDGVDVSYPDFPVEGYSSGYTNSTLSMSEIDYTALKVTVDEDVEGPMALKVSVSYVSDTGEHSQTHVLPIGEDDEAPVNTTTTAAPTTTAPPTTAAPTTTAPPTTAAPTTAAPTTAAPTTTAPPTTAAPTTAAPTTAPPTTAAPALPEVIKFMLIDANNDSVVRELKDGDTISKSDYRRFSIEAITDGPAESVVFTSNGRDVRTESFEPYLIASDWYGDFHPWNVSNGTYEITATPFTADSAGGLEGEARTITVTVRR